MTERMNTLTKILYSLIFIILFVTSTQTIFNFFDIGFDKYGNFLLWLVSLIIFFALLPSRPYAFDKQ
jgi:hypothetical protein